MWEWCMQEYKDREEAEQAREHYIRQGFQVTEPELDEGVYTIQITYIGRKKND